MKLYNIYFPKFYNDGKEVPEKVMADILNEIIVKFGKASYQKNVKLPLIQGTWTSKDGKLYSEEVSLLCLVIENKLSHVKWFIEKAEEWREKLDQEEFFIVVQYADVIRAIKK